LQFLNIFRCKWREEDIDIGFIPGDTSTAEKESGNTLDVDPTELQTIIYDAMLIALTSRGFLYLALPIVPCALTFPH
jgi:CBS-domain-containing membrane protein